MGSLPFKKIKNEDLRNLFTSSCLCNCGAAENNFYNNFMAAENACAAGDGYGSCMAIQLGFLSEDCRTQFPDAINAALEGHEEFGEGCIVEPFPESFDANAGWQWPGAYPYAAADAAYTNFLGCLKALYIGTCQQRALDTFHCNAQYI